MILLVLASCSYTAEEAPPPDGPRPVLDDGDVPSVQAAVAELADLEGQKRGTVSFIRGEKGIRVEARVTGLKPGTKHGFHIHEGEACGDDFAAAGGHFAPHDEPHGRFSPNSHAGDFGNIQADDDGLAEATWFTDDITLDGDSSVLRRTVVLHAGKDDLESQPSGDAGPRMACGPVEALGSAAP